MLAKGIVCSMEANDIDLSEAGTTKATIDLQNEDCWPPKFINEPSNAKQKEIEAFATIELFEDGGWDKSISLSLGQESDNPPMKLSFKNTEELIAMKFENNDESEGDNDAWAFTLTSDGKLIFETKSFTMERQSDGWSRTVRIYVEGKVKASIEEGTVSSEFESIEKFEGLSLDGGYIGNTETLNFNIATMRGTSEKGFLTQVYKLPDSTEGQGVMGDWANIEDYQDVSAYQVEQGNPICFPVDKKCEGIEAIKIKPGEEIMFMAETKAADLETTPVEWAAGLAKPLSFEGVEVKFKQE